MAFQAQAELAAQAGPRILEDATDELARLDTLCRLAPASVGLVLRLAAKADAASLGFPEPSDPAAPHVLEPGMGVRILTAALVDPMAEDRVSAHLIHWAEIIENAERLVRGGAPLTMGRLARLGEELGSTHASLSADPSAAALIESALRDAAPRRSALDRAVEIAGLLDDPAVAEVAAALVLCAAGRTDRIRLLPFATARAGSSGGDADRARSTWPARALSALTTAARKRRLAVHALLDARADEEARLDRLGRAAINARRALEVLRESLACTMPSLAADLALSRPAAADALERLGDAGLAVEITGRRRDRVYAYEAALAIAGAAAS